ncbi:hypothetical protein CCAX7_31130 [Capsulimonas corticalis]|uniref:Uncharacterized protein n=1 Tax=Capsulimonas corticalis TaxID=2219043 RepID=A0A402CSJ3_9BACT|nr:hypothetical protein [Capsulimonas corticalis]BDI31062.1 hypothetical protein CCAX7_31130 [Capsulimonas corticalis]
MLIPDNTTSSPLDSVRRETRERHGVGISFLKEQVGDGVIYENETARAVFSEAGGYFELCDLPEEFSGALGAEVTHSLIDTAATRRHLAALEQVIAALLSGTLSFPLFSLYLIYEGGDLRTRENLFVFEARAGAPPMLFGSWSQEELPRFAKIRLLAPPAASLAGLPMVNGVQFLLAPRHTDDGRFLLGQLPRTSDAADLGLHAAPGMAN